MNIIVAIDSFKGCLSSAEANRAAAEGVNIACPEATIVQVPVSDGGEGFIDAFHSAIGGQMVEVTVNDPLMRPINAHYLLEGEMAVIEIAQASGLTLLSVEERNPMKASSYGTGQLVANAVQQGARHIIVGLGGSAVSDAGRGMLQAISDALSTDGKWTGIKALRGICFTIASDVQNPLYGKQGAAYIFAPQKGATPEMVRQLDDRAKQFADSSARLFGFDRSQLPGAGAAGGLGYAFMQYMDAECRPGIDLLLDTIGFSDMTRSASLIITGEGSADSQTLMGKLPMGILRHAADVPVCLIAGQVSQRDLLLQAGFHRVECINPPALTIEEAIKPEIAKRNIAATVRRLF